MKNPGDFATVDATASPPPHYADQTARFSRRERITFPYTDEQIQADPNYARVTISE